MKKTIYLLLAFLLVFTSCVQELNPVDKFPKAEDKGKVAVTMTLKIPSVELSADTKANTRSINPQIDYIRVAVFGTSGYLQDYAYAEPVNTYAVTNDDEYTFKVLLPVYEGEAHVHVIANGPESIPYVGPDGDQTEDVLMSKMETTADVGGFWARVVLPDGILPKFTSDGIMQTDSNGNFIPSDETKERFEGLTLIRNFAQITLDVESGSGISDVTWILVNDPVSGAMAPMKDGKFVDTYKYYDYDVATGRMVRAEGDYDGEHLPADTYDGYMASSALNETIPAGTAITTSADVPLFCYERVDPNKTKPTFILMKAKFTDNQYYYYRVDLIDEALGGYFPLYRNYTYQIKIHRVGNKGADTPEEAALRNSGGNVSMSAETKTLTDVSDGFSRLYVEFVEKTYTTGGQKRFWAYYVPDVSTGAVDNSSIQVTVKDMGTHPALANATITKDDSDPAMNWYTVTLNDQNATYDLSSVLQVVATNGQTGDEKSTLYRDVTLKVMKTMDMNLSLDHKKLDEGIGETTVLHIALADTLQESMFPLEFYIEDTNRTLNPTGKDGDGNTITVPVKVGKSIYDDTNDNSYYFIRTVNWSEYEPMKIAGNIDFTTEFKTIKAQSATTIWVDNEYFNSKSVNLVNDALYVTTAQPTVASTATSVVVNVVTAEDTDEWTVTGTSTGVTATPSSGNGSGTFTMNFTANTSTTASVTRTATVTSGSVSKTVTVTQQPFEFSVTTATPNVAYNAPTATVTVHAEEGFAWTVTANNGATVSPASGTGTQNVTVTLQPNTNNNARTVTVTATLTSSSSTASADIVQARGPANQPYSFTVANLSNNGNFNGNSSATSSDGYITVSLANCRRRNNNGYIEMSNNTNRGTVTITPNNGVKITGVVLTYANGYVETTNQPPTVSAGTFSISGNSLTWTVESTGAITLTSGITGAANNSRHLTGIRLTYE